MKKRKADVSSYHEQERSEQIQACSATDCTGLIPALPETNEQLENYEELYPFLAKAADVQKTE